MYIRVIVFIWIISSLVSSSAWAQYYKCDTDKLTQGMAISEVRNICGRPHHVNRYGSSSGDTEQWVYKEGRLQELYLYFDNGLYTGIFQRFGEKRRLP